MFRKISISNKFTSVSLLWISLIVIDTPCVVCVGQATSEQIKNITIMIYTGETTAEYTSVLAKDVKNEINLIDTSKPTIFYIFGWSEDPNSESVQTVLGAYLPRKDHNVILGNYEQIAALFYPIAVLNAQRVGYTFAMALNDLVEAGVKSDTIHVIGHSLGGQVAGWVGRYVNSKLTRITGLDPAGPIFDFMTKWQLSAADALFVDIIHTDSGGFGTKTRLGTVNFNPNGGTAIQPGCESSIFSNLFCSHHRSWEFYAESLLKEKSFLGMQCDSRLNFVSRSCNSNKIEIMGYATSINASGNFQLQTNSEFPFGRGKAGLTYSAV